MTPASPAMPCDNEYIPFALSDDDSRHDRSQGMEEQQHSPDLDKHEPDFQHPSLDDIPLHPAPSSSSSSITLTHDRRRSFPRFLHPEHLPTLSAPPLEDGDRKRKRKRLAIRLFLVLAIVAIAIGLGVGLSQPNRSATSQNVGGIAPSTPAQQAGPTTQARAIINSNAPWTKLATSESSTTELVSTTSGSGAVAPPLNTRPSTLGNPKGIGGVQLHQRAPALAKHTAQRRKLRQFGQGTVAGWK